MADNPIQKRILAFLGDRPKPAAAGDEPAIAQILRKRAAQPRPTKLGEGVSDGISGNEIGLGMVYDVACALHEPRVELRTNQRQLSQAIGLARRAGWDQAQIDAAVAAGQPKESDGGL
jgi:hypothetical protein